MPEVAQVTYDLREITELMIRDRGIKSGLWMIWTKFNFAATNIVGADGGPSGPGIVSQLVELGIQRVPEPGPLAVDAAKAWAADEQDPTAETQRT